jgi:hypothetical protein
MSCGSGIRAPQPSVDQLTAWLTDARNKLHQLQTGRLSVEVMGDGYMVKYARADIEKLKAYIADLEAKIEGRKLGGAIIPIW